MPKPKRIQRLDDIGSKALAEYEQAIGQRRERDARAAQREVADALQGVADQQGWTIRETASEEKNHDR